MHAFQSMNVVKLFRIDLSFNWKSHFRKPVGPALKNKAQQREEQETTALRFEISTEKMKELLARHHIYVADIRCLDACSKQSLKQLCLKTCLLNPVINKENHND